MFTVKISGQAMPRPGYHTAIGRLQLLSSSNTTFTRAGTGYQNLCHSPKRKPSEASRQRHLQAMFGGYTPQPLMISSQIDFYKSSGLAIMRPMYF